MASYQQDTGFRCTPPESPERDRNLACINRSPLSADRSLVYGYRIRMYGSRNPVYGVKVAYGRQGLGCSHLSTPYNPNR